MPTPPKPLNEVAIREADNLARLFRFVCHRALLAAERGTFEFTPDIILAMHRLALDGLTDDAGEFRSGRVFIVHSEHEPPAAPAVPDLLAEMCLYVSERLPAESPESAVHIAAYVMWRLAWIHPFADGNGRTSRAAGYLVLCVGLGYLLPGDVTILEQIARNKRRYFEVLEDSDIAWRGGRLDVSSLERLIARYLERQLTSALDGDGEEPS